MKRLLALGVVLAVLAWLHLTSTAILVSANPPTDRGEGGPAFDCTYLGTGGFLHVSDNYGLDTAFRREIARVFPDRPLVDVPLTHPIYHLVYEFPKGLPKIHEHDGKPARGFGIFIGDRLAVFYDYECDLGNGWEDAEVHKDPPELREAAIRMGVNLFTYAVTSRPIP